MCPSFSEAENERPLEVMFNEDGDIIEEIEEEEEEEDEAGFMQKEMVALPWDFSRVVESPHPVKENYKFRYFYSDLM